MIRPDPSGEAPILALDGCGWGRRGPRRCV